MPASDSLAGLLDELQAMPARARDLILQSLTKAEREMLEARTEAVRIPDDGLVRFSPWLATRIRHARDEKGDGSTAGEMTAASRQALLRSVDAIVGNARPPQAARTVDSAGRSLLDAMGGFISPRRGKS